MKRSICGIRFSIFICRAPALAFALLAVPLEALEERQGTSLGGLSMRKRPFRVSFITSPSERMPDNGVAIGGSRLQIREDRREIDSPGTAWRKMMMSPRAMVGAAAGKAFLIARPFGPRRAARSTGPAFPSQHRARTLRGACQVGVHRDDDHPHGGALPAAEMGFGNRTMSPPLW